MLEGRNSYAPLPAPRFRAETTPDGGQKIVISAPRSVFPMLFLPVWLCGWAFGAVSATRQFVSTLQPFLALWLCGWMLGGAFAIVTLLWMAAGRETLRVVGGDLEISASLFGFARRRLYRGADIRGLSPSVQVMSLNFRATMENPLVRAPRSGGIKFSYGARTVYAGVGLDDTEGRMIADWLKARLPKTAS
jgi:hypothetical protein